MPRGDATGPRGKGPGTGRGLGDCKPGKVVGKPPRDGRGRGTGGGRGQGRSS